MRFLSVLEQRYYMSSLAFFLFPQTTPQIENMLTRTRTFNALRPQEIYLAEKKDDGMKDMTAN